MKQNVSRDHSTHLTSRIVAPGCRQLADFKTIKLERPVADVAATTAAFGSPVAATRASGGESAVANDGDGQGSHG